MPASRNALAQLALTFTLTVALVPALALGACAGDFEPGSYLASLRLLGVRADLPIAHPGEDVALEALFANPEQLPLEWAWATCTQPSSSTPEACFDALDDGSRVEGPDLTGHVITIPANILSDVPQTARDAVFVGVVVALCPGRFVSGDTHGVPFACEDEAGRLLSLDELQVGFKRIRVREEDRNANPVIEGLTWEDESWPSDFIPEVVPCERDTFARCPAEQRYELSVAISEPETGEDELGSAFEEQQIVQYYATHGRFEHEVRIGSATATRWVGIDTLPGDVVTLFAVARDDRGGLTLTTRQLRVR